MSESSDHEPSGRGDDPSGGPAAPGDHPSLGSPEWRPVPQSPDWDEANCWPRWPTMSIQVTWIRMRIRTTRRRRGWMMTSWRR